MKMETWPPRILAASCEACRVFVITPCRASSPCAPWPFDEPHGHNMVALRLRIARFAGECVTGRERARRVSVEGTWSLCGVHIDGTYRHVESTCAISRRHKDGKYRHVEAHIGT